ncbi:MAG: HD domain-containing protein [Armatimonadetes bacterium]|nr:HD domain-containing protein [Armatimonadota bacterium]
MVHQLTNNFFTGFFFSRLRGTPLLATWLAWVRDVFWSNVLTIPLAIILTTLYLRVHPVGLLAFLVSLPFQRQALRLYVERRSIYAQAVDALVVATDVNFPQAKGHARRVADTATAICREMGLPDTVTETVELGALLHDVGMIGLDDLLENLANLTEEEKGKLRDHVLIGADIARELPRPDIAQIVLLHHEHYDGSGYPRGLRGEGIPLGARIVAVAEVYESMVVGGFPYARPRPPAEVLRAIGQGAGTAFDPRVVQAFTRAVASGALAGLARSRDQQGEIGTPAEQPLPAATREPVP